MGLLFFLLLSSISQSNITVEASCEYHRDSRDFLLKVRNSGDEPAKELALSDRNSGRELKRVGALDPDSSVSVSFQDLKNMIVPLRVTYIDGSGLKRDIVTYCKSSEVGTPVLLTWLHSDPRVLSVRGKSTTLIGATNLSKKKVSLYFRPYFSDDLSVSVGQTSLDLRPGETREVPFHVANTSSQPGSRLFGLVIATVGSGVQVELPLTIEIGRSSWIPSFEWALLALAFFFVFYGIGLYRNEKIGSL